MMIRPAVDGDGPAVAAVFTAARAGMTYLPSLHSAAEGAAYHVAAVRYASSVEVAEVDGVVVGFSVVHEGRLDALYVEPASQGRGIGSALLARAQACNAGGLELWVFEKNSGARALYSRAGFVEVGHIDGSGNEEGEPDVRMQWSGTG
jgi:GNAT superfamily N-acetyltransferase